jgi:hypothetical protein
VAEKQLQAFMARYTPEVRKQAEAVLAKMRALTPGAVELVYDNYNALVIGFGPTERASDAIFSVVLYPRYVSVFFLQGATLPDPAKVLKGKGNVVRHIVIKDPVDLDRPEIAALMALALESAHTPLDVTAGRRMVIKSISAKQRPRRPSVKPRG